MVDLVRRNLVLLALLGATLLVFFAMTLPAMARNRELARLERQRVAERIRMQEQADRLAVELEALQSGDPAMLERVVRQRFRSGGGVLAERP